MAIIICIKDKGGLLNGSKAETDKMGSTVFSSSRTRPLAGANTVKHDKSVRK